VAGNDLVGLRFEQVPILDEPQDLLVPRDHPLAGRESVTLDEAAHDPWVLPDPAACDHHELTAVACAAAGFTPKVAHEAEDWAAVGALVAHGFGVCLKPRLVRVAPDLPVTAIPLAGPAAPRRRIMTCTRRGSRQQRHIALGLEALEAAAVATDAAAPAPVRRVS
jgi:DNA-binding transcriptional LysR family regulator